MTKKTFNMFLQDNTRARLQRFMELSPWCNSLASAIEFIVNQWLDKYESDNGLNKIGGEK